MRRAILLAALIAFAPVAEASASTLPYRSFGDLNGADDCQYETAANLVLSKWPHAVITTADVERAYATYGGFFQGQSVTSDGGQNWTLEGLWAGQNYLIDVGFAGHRAASIVEVSGAANLVYAADHGGLEVTVQGPTMEHMFAITGANATHLTEVDVGYVTHPSWSWLRFSYTHALGPNVTQTDPDWVSNGEVLTFYAVKWS